MKVNFALLFACLAYANAGFLPASPVAAYTAPVAYPLSYTYSQQVAYPQHLAYAQPALAYSAPTIYRQPLAHPVYYRSPLLSAPVFANHHPQTTFSIVTPAQSGIPHIPQLPAAPQQPQFPQQPQQPQFPQGPSQGSPLPVEPAEDSFSGSGPQFPPAQQPTFSPPPSSGTSSDDDSVSVEAA